MANPTNLYETSLGLQQPSASDLTDGTIGTGPVVLESYVTQNTQVFSVNGTTIQSPFFSPLLVNGIDISSPLSNNGVAIAGTQPNLSVNGKIVQNPFNSPLLVNGADISSPLNNNGLAISSISSMIEPTIFSGSGTGSTLRLLNTVYYNGTGYWLLVSVVYYNSSSNIATTVVSDSSATPTTIVSGFITPNFGFGPCTHKFLVAPGNYYKVTSASGTPTYTWREFICQKGTIVNTGNQSGSRSNQTVYRNSTNNTMLIAIVMNGSSSDGSSAVFESDVFSPPTSQIAIATNGSDTVSSSSPSMFVIVPPGHYYKIVLTGSITITYWYEYLWNISSTRSNDLAVAPALRTATASTGSVSTGSTTASYTFPQCWVNDSASVRWVAVTCTNSAVDGQTNLGAGDGIPPPIALDLTAALHASQAVSVCGPVMPGKVYSASGSTASSTFTTNHWFEYSLG